MKLKQPSIKVKVCDNLELLSEMASNTVDLIYCDILYGTGRKFKDYQDLNPVRDEIENHYKPRIEEMHRVLKPTGSIYLQMDTKINHWIRCIMDDIFGYVNFRNEIIWRYGKMSNSNTNFPKNHDCIVYYSKSEFFTFNRQNTKENMPLRTRLNKFIKNEKITWGSIKGYRSQLTDNYVNSTKNKLNRNLIDSDVIIDFNTTAKIAQSVWVDIPIIKGNSNERTGYDTQKPKALIERIIKASSNEGDLVADFYLGSGTTAEVCKILNRGFIGCDINPNAVKKAKGRL